MSAGKFIGRVGGLAVALGIGVAAYSGTAVAWADSPSSGPSSHGSSARSTGSGSADSSNGPRSAAVRGGAKTALPSKARITAPAPLPAATPELTAPAPLTNDTPVTPTDLPLALTALANSRRETAVATVAPAAALSAAAEVPEVPEVQVQDVAQNVALIMGPSGVPVPKPKYVEDVFNTYVVPNSPDGTTPEVLFTPEGLYPITGVKSLPLNVSVGQGNQILYDEILQQLNAGNTVTVFGYSQSSIISSLVMGPDNTDCVNTAKCSIDPGDPVNFVLVGNEMNPNGGFLSRFPGLNLPSLGIPFYGPTPADAFPVANYTLEYDGFADFPQYPLNVLSVLNAGLGIVFVHTKYADVTDLSTAIELPTTSPTQKYYIIPTENLPLLEPLRLIPVIGNPIADLLQPALKVIVNLGYGDPKYGWSNEGYANELTSFGIFPKVNWVEVAQLFVAGVVQGIQDFIADISPGGSVSQELHALFHPTPSSGSQAPQSFPDTIISAIQTVTTNIGEFISNAAASLYAALLPTADILNAFVTMLPTYDINLFLDGVQQILSGDVIGGLVNAIGLPIAADVGLVTLSALIEVLVIGQAVAGVFEGL